MLNCMPVCYIVLNLVISGIPSIQIKSKELIFVLVGSFKPCYKWNTFNTQFQNVENIESLEF